jgi:cytochrome c-type biogenesis protein CcmH/NrfF
MPSRTDVLTHISRVRARLRCPKCYARSIVHSSSNVGKDQENLALWAFVQRCIMCGWDKTVSPVKVGA